MLRRKKQQARHQGLRQEQAGSKYCRTKTRACVHHHSTESPARKVYGVRSRTLVAVVNNQAVLGVVKPSRWIRITSEDGRTIDQGIACYIAELALPR